MGLKRLMFLIYFTAALVILLGGTSFYTMQVMETNVVEIEEHSHLVETVAELQSMFTEVIMPGNDYLITASAEEKATFEELNKELMEEFKLLEDQMEEHPEEKVILTGVKEEYLDQVKPLVEEILALQNPIGNTDGMQLMEEMDGKAVEVAGKLEKIHEQIAGDNGKLIKETERLGIIALIVVASVGIFVIILSVTTAFVVKQGLIKPILELTEVSTQVAEGDLSQKIDVKAKGEIGQLTESFKVMVSNIRVLISTVNNSAQNVAATSEELASNSDEAAKATQQVAGAMQEVAKGTTDQTHYISNSTELVNQVNQAIEKITTGAGEQVENVNVTVRLVGQMADSIQEVAAGAQTVANSAGKTKEAADKGAKAVNMSIRGMDGIKDKVFESADKIKELGEHSEQIGEIIQVIDDIAEQTNLLALNAAIEAARAGEHGKGFAVVADEVRKLAERSGKATKEIAELITNIQKLTASAVTAMEEGTGEVEQGALLVRDAGDALREILSTVEETYQQVQSISAAAEQISSSSREVVKAVDNVSSITEENSAAMEQITAASQEVASAMQNVSAVSQETSASVEEVSASTEELNASVEEISAAADNLAKMAEELRQAAVKFRF